MASSEEQKGVNDACANSSDETNTAVARNEHYSEQTDDEQQVIKGDMVREGIEKTCNEFSTKTWEEDLTVTVEGKHLYVTSGVLALISPVFSTMIQEVFKEEGPKTLEPTDNYDDFVEFLRCIYPGIMKPVTEEKALVIISMAHKYNIDSVKATCTHILLDMVCEKTTLKTLASILNTASACQLTSLREECIAEMTKRNIHDSELNRLKLSTDVRLEMKTAKIGSLEAEVQLLKERLQKRTDRCVEFENRVLQTCLEDNKYEIKNSASAELHLISVNVFANGNYSAEPVYFRNTKWTLKVERYNTQISPGDKETRKELCVVLSAQGDRSWRQWRCKVKTSCSVFDGITREWQNTVDELGFGIIPVGSGSS